MVLRCPLKKNETQITTQDCWKRRIFVTKRFEKNKVRNYTVDEKNVLAGLTNRGITLITLIGVA